jgi:hypothetical protein
MVEVRHARRWAARPRSSCGGARGSDYRRLGQDMRAPSVVRGMTAKPATRRPTSAWLTGNRGVTHPTVEAAIQRDSALWIHRLAVRCQELGPAADRPAYAQRPRPRLGQEAAEALLAAVPGISTACARALLARFGSVAGVVAAGPAEWLRCRASVPSRHAPSSRPFGSARLHHPSWITSRTG